MFWMAAALLLTVSLAGAVLTVVAVGVGGRHTRILSFDKFASKAVEHLNGDGEPPSKFAHLIKH